MGARLLLLLGLCSAGPSDQPKLRLHVSGEPEAALLNEDVACEGRDYPDTPARAVRQADRAVQLYATDRDNRLSTGPDLLHLEHRCPVVFRGGEQDDPAAFDDRAWIASPWTADGRTIWAIVHNEFQGHVRPARCPSGRYMDCWYNALTLAVSHDGGRRFQRAPGRALVAALPYRYDQLAPGHHGYFNPSNIVTLEDAHYMFVFATKANAQRGGNCLLRTEAVEQAGAWKGWSGTGFTVEFVDPYAGTAQPEEHVCAPVDVGNLRWPVTSLVRHSETGAFVALMQDTTPSGGVYYATSADLLHWSMPMLLLRASGPSGWRCGDPAPIAYPSLLDPTSPDRNFATVADQPQLFVTQFDVDGCRLANRRLVRRAVTVESP